MRGEDLTKALDEVEAKRGGFRMVILKKQH